MYGTVAKIRVCLKAKPSYFPGAKTALALGSSQDHFYSGSSTVAGIQESLSCHSLLAVVDDMESRKKVRCMMDALFFSQVEKRKVTNPQYPII